MIQDIEILNTLLSATEIMFAVEDFLLLQKSTLVMEGFKLMTRLGLKIIRSQTSLWQHGGNTSAKNGIKNPGQNVFRTK